MRFLSLSHDEPDGVLYASEVEVESSVYSGVTFVIRRCSGARRLELMRRLAEHASEYEALRSTERADDRLKAEALRLRMDFEYLDWGLAQVRGLTVDGQCPDAMCLFERGPEGLLREVVSRIREECELNEAERKN